MCCNLQSMLRVMFDLVFLVQISIINFLLWYVQFLLGLSRFISARLGVISMIMSLILQTLMIFFCSTAIMVMQLLVLCLYLSLINWVVIDKSHDSYHGFYEGLFLFPPSFVFDTFLIMLIFYVGVLEIKSWRCFGN